MVSHWFKKTNTKAFMMRKNYRSRNSYFFFDLVLASAFVFKLIPDTPIVSCKLLMAPHKKFPPYAGGVCCHHAAEIVFQWQKAKKFQTFEEVMMDVEEFLFDNTVASDNITHEVADFFIDTLGATWTGQNWPPFTPYQRKYQLMFERDFESYKKLYPFVSPGYFSCQINAEHHSLRDADQRIKNFIKQRDIVDIGSFVGDSMLVLHPYTDKNVYCFEVNSESYASLVKNAETVGPKIKTFLMGMGSKEYTTGILHKQGMSARIEGKGDNEVHIKTLNNISRELNISIGLIKADVEGMAYDIILGAKEAIALHRPVFTLLVYHSYDEFHGIPQVLKEIGGYIFEYRGSHSYHYDLAEGQLFAIPQEVYYPNYYGDSKPPDNRSFE